LSEIQKTINSKCRGLLENTDIIFSEETEKSNKSLSRDGVPPGRNLTQDPRLDNMRRSVMLMLMQAQMPSRLLCA
jgi:hypothetical protein